jgi:hypothetical protein
VTTNSDDNEPTAAAGHADETAVVAESPRTVAAEQYSDAPTTIVPDLGPSRASELAWSSEADTEELSDHRRGWRGRLLWVPLVALLCISVAVVVWFSVTLYRQHERPVRTSPYAARARRYATVGCPAASGAPADSADQCASAPDNHHHVRNGKWSDHRRTMFRLVKDRPRSQHRTDDHL